MGSLEQKLKKLENELKALKGAYPTAGALAKMFVQDMGEELVGGSGSIHDIRIQFTPTYGLGKNNIITLAPVVKRIYLGGTLEYVPPYEVEPQDGSGNVVVRIASVAANEIVNVYASGTSSGTFSRL